MFTRFCIAGVIYSVLFSSTAFAQEEGFESLFDGESLKGWDGNPQLWRVEEGVIVGQTSDDAPLKQNDFLIWDGEVDDFVLRLDFRVAKGGKANSGVQYRSKRLSDIGQWVVGGYQADIDGTNQYMGILYEERGRAILALRGEAVELLPGAKKVQKKVTGSVGDPADIVAEVRPGEWQSYEIRAIDNKLEHILNGKTTIKVVDNDTANAAKHGILALQVHVGPAMKIEFKNIRLKRIGEQ